MEDSDVVLRLTEEEALTLQDLLKITRGECEAGMYFPRSTFEDYAFRTLNSKIDPIIEQLEVELETLGAN